jgi:hypothetical protein
VNEIPSTMKYRLGEALIPARRSKRSALPGELVLWPGATRTVILQEGKLWAKSSGKAKEFW